MHTLCTLCGECVPLVSLQATKWLEASAELYASILDAMDSLDSAKALKGIWEKDFVGSGKSPMVQRLVSILKPVRGS